MKFKKLALLALLSLMSAPVIAMEAENVPEAGVEVQGVPAEEGVVVPESRCMRLGRKVAQGKQLAGRAITYANNHKNDAAKAAVAGGLAFVGGSVVSKLVWLTDQTCGVVSDYMVEPVVNLISYHPIIVSAPVAIAAIYHRDKVLNGAKATLSGLNNLVNGNQNDNG